MHVGCLKRKGNVNEVWLMVDAILRTLEHGTTEKKYRFSHIWHHKSMVKDTTSAYMAALLRSYCKMRKHDLLLHRGRILWTFYKSNATTENSCPRPRRQKHFCPCSSAFVSELDFIVDTGVRASL